MPPDPAGCCVRRVTALRPHHLQIARYGPATVHNAMNFSITNPGRIKLFYLGGKLILAEVENVAVLKAFTLEVWGGGHVSPGNFGRFRCSEAHSGAFWGIQWSTHSVLRRGLLGGSLHRCHLLSFWNWKGRLSFHPIPCGTALIVHVTSGSTYTTSVKTVELLVILLHETS